MITAFKVDLQYLKLVTHKIYIALTHNYTVTSRLGTAPHPSYYTILLDIQAYTTQKLIDYLILQGRDIEPMLGAYGSLTGFYAEELSEWDINILIEFKFNVERNYSRYESYKEDDLPYTKDNMGNFLSLP